MEKKKPYDDLTPMPFGQYKNMALANVPADYLLSIYKNRLSFDDDRLLEYIDDNLDVLRFELSREKNY